MGFINQLIPGDAYLKGLTPSSWLAFFYMANPHLLVVKPTILAVRAQLTAINGFITPRTSWFYLIINPFKTVSWAITVFVIINPINTINIH